MELPQPPQDQELKNIIDKLAQFVARNGLEFEQMTKTKQKDNPKFSFLFGGDYFNYYQYKVTTEQAILKHRQSREQNANEQQQQQQPQLHPTSMGGYQGTSDPRYNAPAFPYQQYPPTSGFGGGESGQYPPGVMMGNYHQQHQHQYQMPVPPGSEQPHPMTTVSNAPTASAPNFRPTFPPGDPSYNSSYNGPPNSSEEIYNQPHNVFNPPPPPPASMSEPYNNQTSALMGPPGNDTSGVNNFQHLGPPLPPQPPPSNDPGPVPVPGGRPTNSVTMQPQGLETTMESINFQLHQLQEQIKQSEQNLEAQRQMIEQQKSVQIRDGVYMARGDMLKKEAADLNLDIQEFEDVLTPITESCTKDSIANGKHWIFTHADSEESNSWISQYLLFKSTCAAGSFTHKLHIIYLMNDVLHHCLRKNADGLKENLERVLAPMYCHAVSSASDDQKTKLDKLLNLWESKMHLEEDLLNQLHTPIESWADYEKELLKDCPQVVSAITLHLNSTFESYQQQHNAFVQHATTQIQQLEQQKQLLEQQQQLLHSAPEPARKEISMQSVPSGIPVSYVPMGAHPQHPFMQTGPAIPPQALGQGMDFNQPPPGYPSGVVPPMIDFSKPPPGFATDDQQKENLVPTVPYFELPAGLMAPLIHIEDSKYKPIDPTMLRLPLPAPPSERLLRAVENFYQPPCHERPRNCEGWEQLALYDYYKAKSTAVKEKERQLSEGLREASRSPSPIILEHSLETDEPQPQRPFRRYRSISPEDQPEELVVVPETPRRKHSPIIPPVENRENRKPVYRRSRSRSPPPIARFRSPPQVYARSPPQVYTRSPRRSRSRSHSRSSRSRSPTRSRSPSRSRSRSRTRSRSRSRTKSRSRSRSRSASPVRVPFRKSRSRSITPPSFGMASFNRTGEIDESNKGHQMLRNMGWSGSGLGAKEQGISTPISAAEVRETPQERFRGLGVPSAQSDPFEAFRKNKGQAFINRMKARAEEKH